MMKIVSVTKMTCVSDSMWLFGNLHDRTPCLMALAVCLLSIYRLHVGIPNTGKFVCSPSLCSLYVSLLVWFVQSVGGAIVPGFKIIVVVIVVLLVSRYGLESSWQVGIRLLAAHGYFFFSHSHFMYGASPTS